MADNKSTKQAWSPEKRLNKQIIFFILFTVIFAWPFVILGSVAHIDTTRFPLVYLAPLFSLGLTVYLTGEQKCGYNPQCSSSGIKFAIKPKNGVKYYLIAYLLPIILGILGACLFFVVKGGQFAQPTFTSKFTKILALSLTGKVLYAGVFALAMQAGWVAFLMPRLNERFGTVKAMLVSGVVAGVWNWPMLYFQCKKVAATLTSPTGEVLKTSSGYLYGVEYPGAPFTGFVAIIVYCFAMGVVLWWLYNKTESILVTSLAAGSFKIMNSLPLLFLNVQAYTTRQYIYGPGMAGLIAVVPLLAFAIYLLATKKDEMNMTLNILEQD